ncbi:MAG: penicillin-binding protein 2 [Gammaproteobacteria bacterium]|nr:penicillin-binding protein 2 [Gammaproteobacteria bacterium]
MPPQAATIKDHIRESNIFFARSVLALVLVVVLLSILLARMYWLQVTEHDRFKTLAENNRITLIPIAPARGLIYDRKGVVLAENRSMFVLEVVPEQVKDLKATVAELRQLIAISDNDWEHFQANRLRSRSFQAQVLRSNLSDTEVAAFSVNRHRFPGVSVQPRLIRHYPHGEAFAHALGYVGRINEKELAEIDPGNYKATQYIGKLGIEKFYEKELHGTVGYEEVETDVHGRVLRTLRRVPPVAGKDLHLHLDAGLQQAAEQALGEQRGAVIALDPQTGGILALVSKPGYDPNLFVTGIPSTIYKALRASPEQPLFNRALRGTYPPGSTIKPMLALLGLKEGVVTPSTVVYDPGFFQLPKSSHKYRDWRKGGHGAVSLEFSLMQSCDIYYYTLAHKLGIDRISPHFEHLGFGRLNGLDNGDEMAGILPSRAWKRAKRREAWYPGDTVNIGIGQGFWSVTSLQLAQATARLANRGTAYQPRMVKALAQSGVPEALPPVPDGEPLAIAPEHWGPVMEAMRKTSMHERGTAYKAFKGAPYTHAGKTGTAQRFSVKQNAKYDEKNVAAKLRDNAMYIGFAPFEKPEIVVAVAAENAGHGGSSAAPVARAVMDFYLNQGKMTLPAPGMEEDVGEEEVGGEER